MDEFTSLLVSDDTRVLVDLLKLSVCGRAGDKGREVLSAVLSGMGTAYPQVSPGRAAWALLSAGKAAVDVTSYLVLDFILVDGSRGGFWVKQVPSLSDVPQGCPPARL